MFWDNREFTTPAEDLKIPDLKRETVDLFRGLTQERVDMLKSIKLEGSQRIQRDNELYKEMYAFGMIKCDIFDDDLKLVKLIFTDSGSIELPCMTTGLNVFALSTDTYRISIPENIAMYLRPVVKAGSGKKTIVNCAGLKNINGIIVGLNITASATFSEIISMRLIGSFVSGAELIVPETSQNPVEVSGVSYKIECYK